MRAFVLAGAILALPAAAQETARADLFARLDSDRDGVLSAAELRSGAALEASWIAADRNQDGRITREEFTALGATQGAAGYSAKQLLGTGTVRDILLDPQGRVTGLALDGRRVQWDWARLGPGGYVSVPEDGAAAGGTREAPLARRGEWRVSELIGDAVQIEPGVRYANVEDVIITAAGEVSLIVVDSDHAGNRGRYAYPWPSRDAARVRELRAFDYEASGVAPPASAGSR